MKLFTIISEAHPWIKYHPTAKKKIFERNLKSLTLWYPRSKTLNLQNIELLMLSFVELSEHIILELCKGSIPCNLFNFNALIFANVSNLLEPERYGQGRIQQFTWGGRGDMNQRGGGERGRKTL